MLDSGHGEKPGCEWLVKCTDVGDKLANISKLLLYKYERAK